MAKIKDFFHRLYLKFSFSKFGKWLFPIFLICFIFNVNAQSYLGPPSNGIPLEYGARTFGYNFSSSTTTVNLTLDHSNGADGGVYYTDQNITTGTYGVGIGTLLNEPLIANHTYRIIYAVYFTGSNYCGTPNSWANQFYPTTGTTQIDIANRSRIVQYDRLASLNVSVGSADIYSTELSYTIDTCYYYIAFTPKSYVNSLMLPFNTQTTVTGGFRYYGFNIVDLGASQYVTADDIDQSISDLQTALINNQNAIASQAHSDHQNLMNQDHTYNNNASDNLNGQTELNNYDSKTNQLKNLFSTNTTNLDFTLNANATNFIWGIVSSFRALNSKITLLISVVLSFAIVKMILNR